MFAQCLKSYFELFSPKNCSSHQSSHLSDPPFTFFAQTFANIWQNIRNQTFILKFWQFCIISRKNNRFRYKMGKKWFLLLRISNMSVDVGKTKILNLNFILKLNFDQLEVWLKCSSIGESIKLLDLLCHWQCFLIECKRYSINLCCRRWLTAFLEVNFKTFNRWLHHCLESAFALQSNGGWVIQGLETVSHPESVKVKHFPGATAIWAKGSPKARIKVETLLFSGLCSSSKKLIQLKSIKKLTTIMWICFSPRCDALRKCVECRVFHQYWNTVFDSPLACLGVIMDWIAWQKKGNIINHRFRNANDGNSSTNHQKGSHCAQCR